MLGADLAASLRRLAELKQQRDEAKTTYERLDAEYKEAEAELCDAVEESELEPPFKIRDGDDIITFSPRATHYGRVLDEHEAVEALKEEGRGDALVGDKIRGKRLNELVREHLENGQKLPHGIDFYTNRGVTVSRQRATS